MFDELQKKNGYSNKRCKSKCVGHICIVGSIKKCINVFKLILQGFLWKFNLKSQFKKKKYIYIKKIATNLEIYALQVI